MKSIKWNISTIIALFFLVFAFYVLRMVLLKEVKASDQVVASIVETIKGILYLIVGYYFGSSLGSKNKDTLLNEKQNPGV